MIKNPKVNYFKVVNKEYQDFYRFLLECKLAIDDDMVKRVEMELIPATEAVDINSGYMSTINSDIRNVYNSLCIRYGLPKSDLRLYYKPIRRGSAYCIGRIQAFNNIPYPKLPSSSSYVTDQEYELQMEKYEAAKQHYDNISDAKREDFINLQVLINQIYTFIACPVI